MNFTEDELNIISKALCKRAAYRQKLAEEMRRRYETQPHPMLTLDKVNGAFEEIKKCYILQRKVEKLIKK